MRGASLLMGGRGLYSFAQVNYLRTPDSRFAKLDGFNYTPHYFYVNDYEGGQLRMHYLDEGPVDAPTVIMIHGNPTWIYQFRDVIPLLNAAGYRTIATDLMGMGRSDKPTDSLDYSYDRHVSWTTQLFSKIDSALNLNEVTIFGHDYGTPIGIRMMVEHFPIGQISLPFVQMKILPMVYGTDVAFLQKGGYYIQIKAQNGAVVTRKFIKHE